MTQPTTARGIVLPCPMCGDPIANFRLSLADGETLTCQECDAEFATDYVRALIAQWQPVLAWIDAMPASQK